MTPPPPADHEETSMENVKADRVLDARGLQCPMPLVKARKELGQLEPGQVLKIMSTDRGIREGLSGLGEGHAQCRAAGSAD
jgi:TusA-related sulfurtransferase